MFEFLKKIKRGNRLELIVGVIESDDAAFDKAVKLEQYIKEEVALAYKAGMLHFNALDHTLLSIEPVEFELDNNDDGVTVVEFSLVELAKESRIPWGQHEGFGLPADLNEDLLTNLYLQAKGFKS